MGLQLEKLRLNLTTEVVSARLQIIDIYDRGLFSFCELRLYLPLDAQRKCSEWIKLLPLISRIVWTKNPRDPRDGATLSSRTRKRGILKSPSFFSCNLI